MRLVIKDHKYHYRDNYANRNSDYASYQKTWNSFSERIIYRCIRESSEKKRDGSYQNLGCSHTTSFSSDLWGSD